MALKEEFDKKIKKMGWVDMQCIKLCAFCFGLPIGAYFYVWILPYWWIFILIAILAAIKPAYIALKK